MVSTGQPHGPGNRIERGVDGQTKRSSQRKNDADRTGEVDSGQIIKIWLAQIEDQFYSKAVEQFLKYLSKRVM